MASVRVEAARTVGDRTVALELATPEGFAALPGQFVLIRTDVDGEEETGYYTISSPNVDGTFEITVGYHPDGTLGPWLAEREVGDEVVVEGPFGKTKYEGDSDAVVVAEGPGLGPAIGIAERARAAGHAVSVVFVGENPPHADRLDEVREDGGTVSVVDSLADADLPADDDAEVFVFGFQSFVEAAAELLAEQGVDEVHAESFGEK